MGSGIDRRRSASETSIGGVASCRWSEDGEITMMRSTVQTGPWIDASDNVMHRAAAIIQRDAKSRKHGV